VAAVAAGAVVVSVLATSLATAGGSAAQPSGTGSALTLSHPLTSADLVCPVPATVKGVSSATVSAASVPATPVPGTAARAGAASLSLHRLADLPGAAPVAQVGAGQSTLHYAVPPGKAQALVLRATGAFAPGLTASVSIRVASGPGRSLQSVPCSAAGGDAWFVGGGASVGRRSVLLLTNIDAAASTVDVAIVTAAGTQEPTAVQGVTVQPRAQLSFALDVLVPGAVATAVHVSTRSGRVASALADSQVNGLVSEGADWVPATTGPGSTAVITGIPGTPDARSTLGLVVPGPDDAVVNVHLLTGEGTLSPADLQGLSAPSGKLTSVAIPAAETGGGAFTVVVLSDRPAVAGIRAVRSTPGAGSLAEYSYAAATVAAQRTVALSGVEHTATVATFLQLAVPGTADVVVAVTTSTAAVPAAGRVPAVAAASVTVRMTLTAGTTVQVQLGPVGPARSTVVVQTAAGAAPLYLGLVVSEAAPHGALVTGGPIPQAPLTVVLAVTAADPAAGYPGH